MLAVLAGGRRGPRAPSKAPVTVRYAHGWSTLYLDRLDKIVADFTARHPTVKAEHVRLQDNAKLHEELATALAAGTPPDVSMQWRGAMPGLAVEGRPHRPRPVPQARPLRPLDLLRERV